MSLDKAVIYRTYSKYTEVGEKETWEDVVKRCIRGIQSVDALRTMASKPSMLTPDRLEMMRKYMTEMLALPSGRWLWTGGTAWIDDPQNYPGAYNCSSTHFNCLEAFRDLAELCMCGCGIGYALSEENISKLPIVNTKINVIIDGTFGFFEKGHRLENTFVNSGDDGNPITIVVGDSRHGWTEAYYRLIEFAFSNQDELDITINISNVRPKGEPINGFGGVANPDYLTTMFRHVSYHLNLALNRKLNSIEITKILGEFAMVIEKGAVRRSASIAQFDSGDEAPVDAKLNLWKQDENGDWVIDPLDNCLRMANHTIMFNSKPSYQDILDSVNKQYLTGEGAIMYVPEAIARSNADILPRGTGYKQEFINKYCQNPKNGAQILKEIASSQGISLTEGNAKYRASIYGLNPCGEIPLANNLCNLAEVTVGDLEPFNFIQQQEAFQTSSLFAAALLNHKFSKHPRYQEGRFQDQIVAVSITGVFDFFIKLFGTDYLAWTLEKRELTWDKADFKKLNKISSALNIPISCTHGEFFTKVESFYYKAWRAFTEETVEEYCISAGLKVPNRCTTIQPSGTKSLLTNSSPGIHPTWGAYFVRRIRFASEDPVAHACVKAGYSTVKSQNDIANNTDSEVIVEFPMKAKWVDYVDLSKLPDIKSWPALGMFRFYMNAQKCYVGHNASCTINFGDDEIEELSAEIFKTIKEDEGYISVALLSKSDIPFPNLPFENISKEKYDEMMSNIGEFDEEFVRKSDWNKNEKYQLACEGQMCQV